ncbi:disks large-associated protein 5 [Cololabis saira]|uniref:disks large-associated protein 5 n=1 Tax=Cololabis saira TaxID=129043 RepID=UPI002AD4A369|nr:disks large-associated protein 5 [Cololabis saira]
MESRFANLCQRDTSVSMLRVKMSRRRSQSQKENRERAVNTRRQLEKLTEMDISCLDASIAVPNMSTSQENTRSNTNPTKSLAQQERLKQLERWKERKTLEKEKEKREKERKRIFKTGLYQPKDTCNATSRSVAPCPSAKLKEKNVNMAISQSIRVTRSMKQQHGLQEDLKTGANKGRKPVVERLTRANPASVKPAPSAKTKVSGGHPAVAGPATRALSTRSANRATVTKNPVEKDKPKEKPADVRTTRTRALVNPVVPPSGRGRNFKAPVSNTENPAIPKESELNEVQVQEPEKACCPSNQPACSKEEDMCVDQDPKESAPDMDTGLQSFAPEGFVFQAPVGLSSFKLDPLTPRSADAFLTPSTSFNLPPAPVFTLEPQVELREQSPPRTSLTVAPPTPGSPLESKHDVPYFRSEIAKETDSLTSLSLHWESKVEDESIPEEMRDRMRTAVGQARLLMKERFKQFGGLVDDCELGRGEKITTCTDLQGFWDMVYYQVEDVNKKFGALKEAECRGWVEDHKPPPRPRKVVKKPSAAPVSVTGTKAAAKSRLAAVKAAMKAKQQAAKDAVNTDDMSSQEPQPQPGAQMLESTVFDGGFFKVESPARPPVRRSTQLSAALLPQASPRSTYFSPREVIQESLENNDHGHCSPAKPSPTPCSSTIKDVLSDETQSKRSPTQQSESVFPHEGTPVPKLGTQVLASISLENEYASADLPIKDGLPLSPRLSFSLCKTPPPAPHPPEPSSALSFMLSPCISPSQPDISSPAVQVPIETQQSMCHTPDSIVLQELPGLDFERYLQASQRGSLSPMETTESEMFSPMDTNEEMKSPRNQPREVLTPQETALSPMSSLLKLQSPQAQSAETEMLLFTQDLKDRIRESVCPSDLMVFTPPSNK